MEQTFKILLQGDATSLDRSVKGSQKEVAKLSQTIETLRAKMEARKQFLLTETDVGRIKQYNREISWFQSEITRLTNIGKKGFDDMGRSVGTFGRNLTPAISGIRMLAAVIPGLGVAGLIGFATAPLIKYAQELLNVSKAASRLEDISSVIKESSKEYVKAASTVNELRINIDLAKQGFISKDGVVKQFNETIGKTVGVVNDLDGAEQSLIKNGNAYIQMTLMKAAANIALEKAAQKAFEIAEKANQPETTKDLTAPSQQRIKATALAQQNKEYLDITKKANDAFFKGEFQLASELFKKREELFNRLVADNLAPELKKEQDQLLNIAKTFQKSAADISKDFNFNFFDDTKVPKATKPRFNFLDKFFGFNPNGKLTAEQEQQIIKTAEDFYNKFGKAFEIPDFQIAKKPLEEALKFNKEWNAGKFKIKLDPSIEWTAPLNKQIQDAIKNDLPSDVKPLSAIPLVDLFVVQKGEGEKWVNDLKEANKQTAEYEERMKDLAATASGLVAPAFSNMFSAILAGENPMKAFFQSIGQSIQQLMAQLIAAAIQALILSAIFPQGMAGGTIKGFGAIFGKLTGLAHGGIIPPGYSGDTFPAMLSSGEAVIPLNKLSQYLPDAGGNITLNAKLRGKDMLLQGTRTSKSQRRLG